MGHVVQGTISPASPRLIDSGLSPRKMKPSCSDGSGRTQRRLSPRHRTRENGAASKERVGQATRTYRTVMLLPTPSSKP